MNPYKVEIIATLKPPQQILKGISPKDSANSNIWKKPLSVQKIDTTKAPIPISLTQRGAFQAATSKAIRKRVMIIIPAGPPWMKNLDKDQLAFSMVSGVTTPRESTT